jgi:methionyl-tRNA formyltransferase
VLISEMASGVHGTPGQVLDGKLTIACGSGAVRLLRVQSPGKPAMAADEWLRGNRLDAGSILG